MTDAPVLASIGFDKEITSSPLLTDLGSFAPRTEAFRLLRTNMQFLDLDQQPRCLVISSAVPGEGKTMTSTNLALALAQTGRRMLVIDADLRRPRVARQLGLDAAVGLTTVLIGQADVADAIQVHEQSGLHLLASGAKPPNPTEILQSRVTQDLIRQLTDDYDMVIIDAPPLLPVADASVLSTLADGVILVVKHGKTTRDQVAEAIARVDQVGGRLFGVVVNMIPRRSTGSYYYYYYEDTCGPRARPARRPSRRRPGEGGQAAEGRRRAAKAGQVRASRARTATTAGRRTSVPRRPTRPTAPRAARTSSPSSPDGAAARVGEPLPQPDPGAGQGRLDGQLDLLDGRAAQRLRLPPGHRGQPAGRRPAGRRPRHLAGRGAPEGGAAGLEHRGGAVVARRRGPPLRPHGVHPPAAAPEPAALRPEPGEPTRAGCATSTAAGRPPGVAGAVPVQQRVGPLVPDVVFTRRARRAALDLTRVVERIQLVGSPLVLVMELTTPGDNYRAWFPGLEHRMAQMNDLLRDRRTSGRPAAGAVLPDRSRCWLLSPLRATRSTPTAPTSRPPPTASWVRPWPLRSRSGSTQQGHLDQASAPTPTSVGRWARRDA